MDIKETKFLFQQEQTLAYIHTTFSLFGDLFYVNLRKPESVYDKINFTVKIQFSFK